MAKRLFRIIRNQLIRSRNSRIKHAKNIYRIDQNIKDTSTNSPEKPQNDKVPMTPPIQKSNEVGRDSETGSLLLETSFPRNEEKTQKPNHNRKVINRARDLAYINGVKTLLSMSLDDDIFIDSFDRLREKYYGKQIPPEEVQKEVDCIIIDLK